MKPALLLVDDNEEILSFLEEELSELYTVYGCTSGASALELLATHSVQLVISDVMMEGMDGFELCRRLKNDKAYSHLPVVLLTAKNSLQAKVEGLELGADAYIEKPFSPAHLQAQVASLLRNRSQVQAYFANSPLAHIDTMAHSRQEAQFLDALNKAILGQMSDPDFDVEHLAKEMNMSRPTLYRKIKEVSSMTPSELINLTRLKKAAQLMGDGNMKLYEISYQVGFHSQNNFCRNFLKQFGMTPSQFMSHARGVAE